MSSEIKVNIQALFAEAKEAHVASKPNGPVNIEANNGNASIFDGSSEINFALMDKPLINPYVKGDSSKIDGIFNQLSSGGDQEYNLETDAKNISSNLKEVIYSDENNRPSVVLDIIENQIDGANIDLILN